MLRFNSVARRAREFARAKIMYSEDFERTLQWRKIGAPISHGGRAATSQSWWFFCRSARAAEEHGILMCVILMHLAALTTHS